MGSSVEVGLLIQAAVANEVHAECRRVLDAAYNRTPERFVRHAPIPPTVAQGVK